MVLLIDIGNSLGKAVLSNQISPASIIYFDPDNPSALEVALLELPHVKKCFISAVRDLPAALISLLEKNFKITMLNAEMKLPFNLTYKTKATLGPDRIAAVAAAWKKFPQKNALVIDMGTCITYDLIDNQSIYHGGAISPGIRMRYQAMHHFTGKLPLAEPAQNVPLIGDSTDASLQSGVMNGVQAEIEGIIEQYEQLYKDLTVIIGGGDNKYFDKKFKINIFAASNLVLEGLKVILDFNDIR